MKGISKTAHVRGLARSLGHYGTKEMVALLSAVAPTAYFPGMAWTFKTLQKATGKCRTMVSGRMGIRRAVDLMFPLESVIMTP